MSENVLQLIQSAKNVEQLKDLMRQLGLEDIVEEIDKFEELLEDVEQALRYGDYGSRLKFFEKYCKVRTCYNLAKGSYRLYISCLDKLTSEELDDLNVQTIIEVINKMLTSPDFAKYIVVRLVNILQDVIRTVKDSATVRAIEELKKKLQELEARQVDP